LHPGADQRNKLATEKQLEIAMFKRAQSYGQAATG
jgi:hypothetical protein